jgi:hypothetical protein
MFNPDGAGVAEFSQELSAQGGSFRVESVIADAQAFEFGFRCAAGGKGGDIACVVHAIAGAQTQKGEFRNASGLLIDVQVEGARFWLKSEEPLKFSCVKAGETWLVECMQTRGPSGTASTRRLRLDIGAGAPTAEALVLKRVRFEDAAKAESSGSLGSALTQYSVFLKQPGSRDEERAQAEAALRALVHQAEDSLAAAAAKLSEAQVIQDAKAAKEAVTIAETGVKVFADSEYGAQFEALRAQADAFQAELGQGRRAQEAQRLLQIADAYMQEDKTYLAMAYYRYLAGNFAGTEWGNRAKETLDKIGK